MSNPRNYRRFVCAWAVIALLALAALPVDALNVNSWHMAGHRGQRIKVAILDSGFRGYRNHLGKCLPKQVQVRSFRQDGELEAKDSQHGILCGEVVHALAPDAELLFANWQPDSAASFIEAVGWARRQGANIITCSVIMPCWSDGEGGGPNHVALRRFVGDGRTTGDPICIACAGNVAERHWSGAIRDAGDGWHRWPDGTIHNLVTAWGDELVSIEVCRPAGTHLELRVLELDGREVGRAASRIDDGGKALVVRFIPRPRGEYRVCIRGVAGRFHLTALGATLAQHSAVGSIPFPGDGDEWLTVGAWEDGKRAGYSSCGPVGQSFKPDLIGAVPVPSRWRAQPFGGTSAAAPQAAGMAALYWSRHPTLTAMEVRSALCGAARDVLAPGHDPESGYGLLRLPPIGP